jgi:putative transposase
MPRIPRISIPGLALHVVHRGNNRQAVFFQDRDRIRYLDLLFESCERYEVSVHAYVCMTNHVHILMTPWHEATASKTMQRMGASYTACINAIYNRTGSLWEGRFKSSLVDSERYVLGCYCYIELNPVRAGMVLQPSDYRWSSYRHNAHGLSDYPIRPHPEWMALGADVWARHRRHAQLVAGGMTHEQVEKFRRSTSKGLPAGSQHFQAEVEAALARRLGDGQRGRPKKGL